MYPLYLGPTNAAAYSNTVHVADCRRSIMRLKHDGTRAETRLRLSPKGTSPFKSVGASIQSTTGSRGVPIGGSNAGYTTFRGSVRVLATHSIRQFLLHFPSPASPCAIRFQTHSTALLLDRGTEGTILYSTCFRGLALPCYQNHSLF